MPRKDPEARRVQNREYYLAHREQIAAYDRAKYQANKEEIKARVSRYRREHLDDYARYARDWRRTPMGYLSEAITRVRSRRKRKLERIQTLTQELAS